MAVEGEVFLVEGGEVRLGDGMAFVAASARAAVGCVSARQAMPAAR